jgi:hypothetical protein
LKFTAKLLVCTSNAHAPTWYEKGLVNKPKFASQFENQIHFFVKALKFKSFQKVIITYFLSSK